ncbi:MAG: serine/threonine protein kinase [Lentisphaeraceae bacterium]|nr:serine/threonine protein kinase [Lentisphaeraceae bacterium]
MDDELRDLARGMKHLYEESKTIPHANAPIYNELGDLVKQYSNKTFLNEGGMKTIYKVFDKKTDRYVAMAELHDDASDELYEIFLREARLTAKLEHPNIISVHDIGLSEDKPFFTMDLKVGDSLRDILRKLAERDEEYQKNYPLNVLLEIFNKICDAMDYAHSRGVIHLDLKPDNIQIGLHGEVLVCDWGLAKIVTEPEFYSGENEVKLSPDLLYSMTQNGELKGTPGYMAPEQASLDGVKTESTDIYALGCLLFSILTYQSTVNGSIEEVLKATKLGNLRLPSKAIPEKFLPQTLDHIFKKATSLKAEERYPSVKALKRDISNFLAGYSTSVDKGYFFREAALFFKRNQTACLTGFSLIFIMFVVTLLFVFNLNRRITEADTAKIIANHLSQKFLGDQQAAKNRYSQLSRDFVLETDKFLNLSVYSKPHESIKVALHTIDEYLKENPENELALDFRYNCLLIKQDFDEIINSASRTSKIYRLAKRYAEIRGSQKFLSEDNLALLFKEAHLFNVELSTLERMLCYQNAAQPRKTLDGAILRLLCIANKDSKKDFYKFSSKTQTLSISSPNFHTVSNLGTNASNLPLTRFLKLENIILTGTKITTPEQIENLPKGIKVVLKP